MGAVSTWDDFLERADSIRVGDRFLPSKANNCVSHHMLISKRSAETQPGSVRKDLASERHFTLLWLQMPSLNNIEVFLSYLSEAISRRGWNRMRAMVSEERRSGAGLWFRRACLVYKSTFLEEWVTNSGKGCLRHDLYPVSVLHLSTWLFSRISHQIGSGRRPLLGLWCLVISRLGVMLLTPGTAKLN